MYKSITIFYALNLQVILQSQFFEFHLEFDFFHFDSLFKVI
jgi:hypothetical protein